jgi:acyl-coenzyme A synthetase/AMP-(fatty) acid ligase
MGQGNEFVTKYDLSSLKLLGSVGEPINPEAWNWYNDVVGQGRCPIVDTWWQTETGGHLITPLPGATRAQARLGNDCPSSACSPCCSTPVRARKSTRPRPRASCA